MCKRNSPDKGVASTGSVRETSKRNFQDKTEARSGCVTETPHVEIKTVWDV